MIIKITLLFLLLSFEVVAQTAFSLPRSTPEAEGVSSEAIIKFLDAVSESTHEFHSLMIVRHGKVIAEGWWKPYRADLKHTMYSVSKSFTATAVGFAVAERKLSVNDKLISFFPDDLPDTTSRYLSELKIKDLLTMSVGHETDPTGPVSRTDDWIKAFLKVPIVNEPGTKFLYNSVATYMLSAIVQKVTGQKVIDYLKPRLFDPLGIHGIDWETDPKGINVGGWGLSLKTEDMAKFGQLFLQKGKWQGKTILPASWVDEATTLKIEQDPSAPQSRKDSSDWLQGYCYQMWRSRNNSYRADGAYGQFIIMMPEHDAVVVITSETPNMQTEFDLVWKYLLPAFHAERLPSNNKQASVLKQRLQSLQLPVSKSGNSAIESKVSGKPYVRAVPQKPVEVKFVFGKSECYVTMKTDSLTERLVFGRGEWRTGLTNQPGPYLVKAKNNRAGMAPYKVAGSYQWTADKNLVLTLRYIETPHTKKIRCRFDGNQLFLQPEDLFDKSRETILLKSM